MGMESKEFKALISLLDDDDEQIVTHVQEKILSLGTQVIPFLEQEWESNFNSQVQRRIEDLIHTLQYELLKERLKEWYQSEEQDLLTGMWLVATYQYPDIELIKPDYIDKAYERTVRSDVRYRFVIDMKNA